jgi:hypothetical protein
MPYRITLKVKHVVSLLVLSAALGTSACFEPLRIEVTGGNEPSFILHEGASGSLGYLIVKEYSTEAGKSIWSVGGKGNYIPMSYFRSTTIHYGDVPSGWSQETPGSGSKPPVLLEGKTYQVTCGMFDTESRVAVFSIKNGKVVQQN